jgi:hypothetical protein
VVFLTIYLFQRAFLMILTILQVVGLMFLIAEHAEIIREQCHHLRIAVKNSEKQTQE